VQQVGVECLQRVAQVRGGVEHSLQCDAFLVEGGIPARQMVLDQPRQAAAEVVIGNRLKRCDVGLHLLQPAAQALTVLHDEARYAGRRQHAGEQHEPIEHGAEETHVSGAGAVGPCTAR
jgi:hypothetical protein